MNGTSPRVVHFHGPKPGRGSYLACLASQQRSCLSNLSRADFYERDLYQLTLMGFRADEGSFANQTMQTYKRMVHHLHQAHSPRFSVKVCHTEE